MIHSPLTQIAKKFYLNYNKFPQSIFVCLLGYIKGEIMKISAISSFIHQTKRQTAFKQNEKPLIHTEGRKDNDIVGYATWGSNYAYPIYARDIKAAKDSPAQRSSNNNETPEEYYTKKLYGTEWTT